ncbi:TetR/AcrR family transcriptional regulator [Pseudooceanicola sp. C21-150M6]|uniref:TetR/AcrR family transcriptional regulator n=1 Tax=Pseudooceanicola sp. C21-150M6 TaxID=3434355 RepID=UPI003D7F55F7
MSSDTGRRLHAVRDMLLQEAELTAVQNPDLVQTRREQICDAALELFLEKGFASTTIRDICARSGVNQASIYDYIANKNDILRRLLNQLWFRPDVTALPDVLSDTDKPLEEVFEAYFRVAWDRKRKGTLLVYRSVPHLLAEDRRAMRAHDLALIHDLARQLERRAEGPLDTARLDILANILIFLSAFGPMRDWLHQDLDSELVLRTVSAGAAAMVRELLRVE